MPVRRDAASLITYLFIGHHSWNGATAECQSMPTDAYEQTETAADLLYERLVDRLDWSRTVIEASSRHLSLVNAGIHPGPRRGPSREYMSDSGAEICGDCLREALLDTDRRSRWIADGQPVTSPRRHQPGTGQDPAVVLADSVRHRQPGFTS